MTIEQHILGTIKWCAKVIIFTMTAFTVIICYCIKHQERETQQINLIENRAKQIMGEENNETVNKALEYVVWGEKQE